MANKKSNATQELAKILYMSGLPQEEIAERAGVTRQTLSRWVNTLGWKEQKAAKNVTRPALVNKLLQSINTMLEEANKPGNEELLASLGDKLIKAASAIEKLEKKTSVVDRIETIIDFENWVIRNRENYPELHPDAIKLINTLHNDYLTEQFRKGGAS
ncbi:MAG: DUF1804 family protein [Mediterranea sp.]|jgi:transcriptional regulator with XRE-family HTH domain|nr:DUF1804 family protein [Mediterranea sp.]